MGGTAYPPAPTNSIGSAGRPTMMILTPSSASFTRAPWVRTPQQVVESLFPTGRRPRGDAPTPPRPENKRVWASLLKGKTAVIQEVAEEMERRDPSRSKTRIALTDGERALQIQIDRTLNVTLIL